MHRQWLQRFKGLSRSQRRDTHGAESHIERPDARVDGMTVRRSDFYAEFNRLPSGRSPVEYGAYAWERLSQVVRDDEDGIAVAETRQSVEAAANFVWPGWNPSNPSNPTNPGNPTHPGGEPVGRPLVMLANWLTGIFHGTDEYLDDYANSKDRTFFRGSVKAAELTDIVAWVAYYYKGGTQGFSFLEKPAQFAILMKEILDEGLGAWPAIGFESHDNDAIAAQYPPERLGRKMKAIAQHCHPYMRGMVCGPEWNERWSKDDMDAIWRPVREVTDKPILVLGTDGRVDVDWEWCSGCLYQSNGHDPSIEQVINECREGLARAKGKLFLLGETNYVQGQSKQWNQDRSNVIAEAVLNALPEVRGSMQGGRLSLIRRPTGPTNPTPTEPSGPRDELDLSHVTFRHRDISGWPITSDLKTVEIVPRSITMPHTKAGVWAAGDPPTDGNCWILAQFDGQWYAATFEWLDPGQIKKYVTRDEIGPLTKKSPFRNWRPRKGETVGFMVSRHARDSFFSGEERSQVRLVEWPY